MERIWRQLSPRHHLRWQLGDSHADRADLVDFLPNLLPIYKRRGTLGLLRVFGSGCIKPASRTRSRLYEKGCGRLEQDLHFP